MYITTDFFDDIWLGLFISGGSENGFVNIKTDYGFPFLKK